ncbi:MAG TPA: TraR/DksA C4-type zinc finger protein [Dehalococcoidales bacterium]|nr:MAG: molecular chaperone DnaK [Chloroflexi bacterium RBG_16_60_22]HJX12061.1 TraR/DksA C4-type zinc finger protein [Dehalococcoidales bacterium]
MTTAKFKKLREQLETEQKRLQNELEQLRTTASTADERREGSPFGKREEEATETLELEKRLALENRIRQELVGIEHALDKFEKGTYGSCDNCGQPIDPERLEALPQASLCMNCKALLAKNAKGKPPTG